MGSIEAPEASLPYLWIETPCIKSVALSKAAGCNIYLKLDNLQPSGSFKSRGIGNLMALAHQTRSHSPSTLPLHYYCPSGGNAGLACITAANTLNAHATIVVPLSTSQSLVQKLRDLGATVYQEGKNWAEADRWLRSEMWTGKSAPREEKVYVPPFDDEDVVKGNASIVEELYRQVPGGFDAIVCSVGGGGLFCGLMKGLENRGRDGDVDVNVVAVETDGADSLNRSLKEGKHIALPAITSIAGSLGAVRVSDTAWEYAQYENVRGIVLSDAQAARACVRFADEERMLVEVSCGVSLAVVYENRLRELIGGGMTDEEWKQQRVVIEVCGGSGVSLEVLEKYRETYGQA